MAQSHKAQPTKKPPKGKGAAAGPPPAGKGGKGLVIMIGIPKAGGASPAKGGAPTKGGKGK